MTTRGASLAPLLGQEAADVHGRAVQGDDFARERMIGAVTRIAYKVAGRSHKYNPDHSVEDYVQEAKLGILRHAIPNFDPARGTRWSTYASWWIRASCWALADRNRIIRLPAHALEKAQREGPEALAALRAEFNVTSLDTPIGEHCDRMLVEFVADPTEQTIDEDIDSVIALRRFVWCALRWLDARNAYIVLSRQLGGLTLDQVGQQLNVTREGIRQMEGTALGRVWMLYERETVEGSGCPGHNGRCEDQPQRCGLCASCWDALEVQAMEANPIPRAKRVVLRQRCLCCGGRPARVFRRADGRRYAACEACTTRCDSCTAILATAKLESMPHG